MQGKMKEAPIQKLILDWLAAEHILAYRMNTGIAKFDERFVAFGVKGMADIIAFKLVGAGIYCRNWVIWIECKATKGKQSEFQKSFQKQVEEQGHTYILARSLEDVMQVLK